MARIARIVVPGRAHLVCQSGEQPIFNSAKRRRAYLEILAGSAETYRIKVLAWSVLRDRVFLVAIPRSAESLSSFMRVAHARYARYLHAAGFTGEVTPRRFASCALDTTTALDAIKFVEWTPVGKKLAVSPAAYPFGSAAVRAGRGEAPRGLLARVPTITGKVRGWARWLAKPLETARAEYLAMRMRTGKPAGGKPFVKSIERKVGANLSRGRGRPKGS